MLLIVSVDLVHNGYPRCDSGAASFRRAGPSEPQRGSARKGRAPPGPASELQFYRKLGPQAGMPIFIMTMRIKIKKIKNVIHK